MHASTQKGCKKELFPLVVFSIVFAHVFAFFVGLFFHDMGLLNPEYDWLWLKSNPGAYLMPLFNIVTHQMIHTDLIHLAANDFCILAYGSILEIGLGPIFVAIVYWLGVVVGSAVYCLNHPNAALIGSSHGTNNQCNSVLVHHCACNF